MREAPHIVDLRHQNGSGHQLETAQTHQRLHCRVQPPLRHLRDQQLLEARQPLRAPVDRLQVLFEHRLEGRQRQDQFPQVPLVGRAPVRLAEVAQLIRLGLLGPLPRGIVETRLRPAGQFQPLVDRGHGHSPAIVPGLRLRLELFSKALG